MTVRVGLIGTGRRGRDHLRRLIEMGNRVEVVAVCDVVQSSAEAAAQQVGSNCRAFTDYTRMFDAARLDAVFIVTPPQLHAGPSIEAARRGVALYLEKPVAFDMPDAKRIAEAVETAGILNTVGYQMRYQPTVQHAHQLLQGKPVAAVRAHWYHCIPLVESLRDKDNSGGQVVEQATHLIDLMRYLVGEIVEVDARYTLMTRTPQEFHNWDGYAVLFSYANGTVGTLTTTYALFPGGTPDNPGMDIISRELLLRLSPPLTTLKIYRPPQEGQRGAQEEVIRSDPQNNPHDITDAFITAVAGGGNENRLLSPVSDALRTMAVTLACNLSAERKAPVQIAELLEARR